MFSWTLRDKNASIIFLFFSKPLEMTLNFPLITSVSAISNLLEISLTSTDRKPWSSITLLPLINSSFIIRSSSFFYQISLIILFSFPFITTSSFWQSLNRSKHDDTSEWVSVAMFFYPSMPIKKSINLTSASIYSAWSK